MFPEHFRCYLSQSLAAAPGNQDTGLSVLLHSHSKILYEISKVAAPSPIFAGFLEPGHAEQHEEPTQALCQPSTQAEGPRRSII